MHDTASHVKELSFTFCCWSLQRVPYCLKDPLSVCTRLQDGNEDSRTGLLLNRRRDQGRPENVHQKAQFAAEAGSHFVVQSAIGTCLGLLQPIPQGSVVNSHDGGRERHRAVLT